MIGSLRTTRSQPSMTTSSSPQTQPSLRSPNHQDTISNNPKKALGHLETSDRESIRSLIAYGTPKFNRSKEVSAVPSSLMGVDSSLALGVTMMCDFRRVAVSLDGTKIASSSSDSTVQMCDTSTLELLFPPFYVGGGRWWCVVFSRTGR